MKSFGLSKYALHGCVAVALLAGCGGSQPLIGPSNGSGLSILGRTFREHLAAFDPTESGRIADSPEYKVSGPLLYVTNVSAAYSSVTVYDASAKDPSPIAVISMGLSEPVGDCIDGDGTLYVTNEPGSSLGWVSEYALGKTKPLRLITKGINIPGYCAIDRRGNLWVANVGGPTVTEYLKTTTKPHITLKNGLTYPNSVAIDSAGDTYVGNLEPYGTSNVQVFSRGGKSPSRSITDGVTWPGGMAVDASGTLYVTNSVAPCNIEEYRAGQSDPYRTITENINGPPDLTFAKNGRMYEVNDGTQGCSGPAPAILEFSSGSIKPSRRMIGKGLHDPQGVAYFPPLLP
ncbi:MAG: hypothetical protein WAK16_05430 [Candidatus Cybelea sp.]|jgi:hypothetical protein